MDNQTALTARFPLTLDLRFLPPWTTPSPIPTYFLMLAAFLIGGLSALIMLLWDRVSLSTRAGMAKMRAGSLERELDRSHRASAKTEEEVKSLQSSLTDKKIEIEQLKAQIKDLEATIANQQMAQIPVNDAKTE